MSEASKKVEETQVARMRAAVRDEIALGRKSKYWVGSSTDAEFMGRSYDQERLLVDLLAAFPAMSEQAIVEAIDSRFAWLKMR